MIYSVQMMGGKVISARPKTELKGRRPWSKKDMLPPFEIIDSPDIPDHLEDEDDDHAIMLQMEKGPIISYASTVVGENVFPEIVQNIRRIRKQTLRLAGEKGLTEKRKEKLKEIYRLSLAALEG